MTNLVFGDYNKDDLKKLYDNNPALTQNLSVTKLSSSVIKYIKLVLSNGFESTDMLIGPDWMVEVIYYDQGELFYAIGRTLPIRSSETITIDCSHDYHKEIKTVAVANIRHIKILDPEDPAVKGGIHLSLIELNKLLGITPPAPTPKPGKEPGQDPKIIDPAVPGKKDPAKPGTEPGKKDEGTGTEPVNPDKKDVGTQTEPETPGVEPKPQPQPEDPAKPGETPGTEPGKKDEGTGTEPVNPGTEPQPQPTPGTEPGKKDEGTGTEPVNPGETPGVEPKPQPEEPVNPGETPGTEQPGTNPDKKDENIPSPTLDPVIDAKTMETKPEGYHVVSFVIENGTFTGSDRFFVKHGTPWMRITPPGAKPKPGYQIVSWNKAFPTTVEEDIELAEVCELKSVVKESEIGHRPEGYYKLTIKQGEGVTLPEGDEVWYAKLDVTLDIEVHPTILQGYTLAPYDIPKHMPATDIEVLIYAVPTTQPKPFVPTEDILSPEGEKPEGYSEVSFNLTEAVPNATVTRYYVKNGTPFERITVPTGFTVSPLYTTDNRFLPTFPDNVTEDVAFTLNVIKKAIVPSKLVESKPEGYHSYVFKLHEHMTVEESTELSYYVATNTKKEDAPKVDAKANHGYVLTETVINPDNEEITTDVEVSYKVYPEIVPANEVGVKPNGYHSVSYVAGNDKARVSGVNQYFTADGVDIGDVPEPTVDIDEECILSKTIEPPMQGPAISNDIVVTYAASLEIYDASLIEGETPAGYHKVTFARTPGSVEVPGLTLPTFNVAHGIDLAKVLKKVQTIHGEYTIVLHETSGAVVADKEVIYTAYPEIIKNPSSNLTIPGYGKVEYVVDEHTELKFDIASTYYINMRNDEEAFKTKIAGTTIVGPDDITVKDEGYALDEPVWATPELVDNVYKVKVRVKALPVKPKYILAEEASEELKNSGEYSLISYEASEGIVANPKPFYILKTLAVTESPMLTKDVKLEENYEIVSIKIPPVPAVEDETIKTPSDITVTLVAYPPVKEYTDQRKYDGYHMVEVKYPHSNIQDERYMVRHGAIITNYITLKPTPIEPGWEREAWVDVDKPIVADTVLKYECKRVAYTEADEVITTDKLETRPDGYYSLTVRTAYPEGYGEYIMNAHIKYNVSLDHPEIVKMINAAKALAHEGDTVLESYSPFMPRISPITEFTMTLYIEGHEPIIKLPDGSPDYASIFINTNSSMPKDESSHISVMVKKGAKISELKLDDILKLVKNEFKPGYNIVSHNWVTLMPSLDSSGISGVEDDGDTIKDTIHLSLIGLPDVVKYIKHENSEDHITSYEVDGLIFDEKPEGYVAVSLAAEHDSSNKVIDLLVKKGTASSKINIPSNEFTIENGYILSEKTTMPEIITEDTNAVISAKRHYTNKIETTDLMSTPPKGYFEINVSSDLPSDFPMYSNKLHVAKECFVSTIINGEFSRFVDEALHGQEKYNDMVVFDWTPESLSYITMNHNVVLRLQRVKPINPGDTVEEEGYAVGSYTVDSNVLEAPIDNVHIPLDTKVNDLTLREVTRYVLLKPGYEVIGFNINGTPIPDSSTVEGVTDGVITGPNVLISLEIKRTIIDDHSGENTPEGYAKVTLASDHGTIAGVNPLYAFKGVDGKELLPFIKPVVSEAGWVAHPLNIPETISDDTTLTYEFEKTYDSGAAVITEDFIVPIPSNYVEMTITSEYPEGTGSYSKKLHVKRGTSIDDNEELKGYINAGVAAYTGTDKVIKEFSPSRPLGGLDYNVKLVLKAYSKPILMLVEEYPDFNDVDHEYAKIEFGRPDSKRYADFTKDFYALKEYKYKDLPIAEVAGITHAKPGHKIDTAPIDSYNDNDNTVSHSPYGYDTEIFDDVVDGDMVVGDMPYHRTVTFTVDSGLKFNFKQIPDPLHEGEFIYQPYTYYVKNGVASSKIPLPILDVVAKGYKLTEDLKWNLPSVITSDINVEVVNKDVIKIDEDADIIDCQYDNLEEKEGYNKFSIIMTQNSIKAPSEKNSSTHDYLVKNGIRRDNPIITDIIKEHTEHLSLEMLRKVSEGYADSTSELITNGLVYNFEYEYILYSSEKINHNYSKIIPYIPEGATVKAKELYGVIGCKLADIPIDEFGFNATEFDTDIYESIQYRTPRTDEIGVYASDNVIHPDIVYKDVIPKDKLKMEPNGQNHSLVTIQGSFNGEYSVHNKSNIFWINRNKVDLLTSPIMEPVYNSFKFEISDDEVFIKDINENIESNKVYIRVAKKIAEDTVLTDVRRNNGFHMLTIASRIPANIAHANYIVHESADLSKIDKSVITVTGLPSYVESYSITLPERIGTTDQTVYVDYERKDVLNTSDYQEKPEGYFTLTYRSDIEGFVEKTQYIESGVSIATLNLAEFAPTPTDASYTVEYTKSSDQTTMDADMIVTYVKSPKILLSEDDITKYGGPKYKTISFNSGLTDQSMFEGIDKTYSVRSDVNPTDVAQFITLPTLKNTDLVTSATFTLPNEVMGDADRVVKPVMEFINIVPVNKFAEGRPEGYIKVTFAPNEIFTNEPLHSTGVEIYAKPGTTELQNYESTLDLTYDTSVHTLTNHFESNIEADTVVTYTFTNN